MTAATAAKRVIGAARAGLASLVTDAIPTMTLRVRLAIAANGVVIAGTVPLAANGIGRMTATVGAVKTANGVMSAALVSTASTARHGWILAMPAAIVTVVVSAVTAMRVTEG